LLHSIQVRPALWQRPAGPVLPSPGRSSQAPPRSWEDTVVAATSLGGGKPHGGGSGAVSFPSTTGRGGAVEAGGDRRDEPRGRPAGESEEACDDLTGSMPSPAITGPLHSARKKPESGLNAFAGSHASRVLAAAKTREAREAANELNLM
ncbi:hypothetical protein THAOC_20051, partial [Thalassiosira oceanica]